MKPKFLRKSIYLVCALGSTVLMSGVYATPLVCTKKVGEGENNTFRVTIDSERKSALVELEVPMPPDVRPNPQVTSLDTLGCSVTAQEKLVCIHKNEKVFARYVALYYPAVNKLLVNEKTVLGGTLSARLYCE